MKINLPSIPDNFTGVMELSPQFIDEPDEPIEPSFAPTLKDNTMAPSMEENASNHAAPSLPTVTAPTLEPSTTGPTTQSKNEPACPGGYLAELKAPIVREPLAQLASGPRLEDSDPDDEEDDGQYGNSDKIIRRVNPKRGTTVNLLLVAGEQRICTHYREGDAELKHSFICPGDGCPVCALGNDPDHIVLRPALRVGSTEIGVLNIPVDHRWKPKRSDERYKHLSGEFVRAVKGRKLDNILLSIKFQGNGFIVTARDRPDNVKIPFQAMDDFARRLTENPRYLSSNFNSFSVQELREVESIAAELQANGL